MRRIITLLTDFGTVDGYVAEMKGVLLTLSAEAVVTDLSHDVPPQDVECARLSVARYWRRFPEGTVHLVVIDPGVGSARAPLAIESDGRFLVGPDNGVLSPALLVGGARVVSLTVPAGASPTFHGRDVFAPVAASLANGVPLDDVGEPHRDAIIRRTPMAHRLADGGIAGEVVAVDRFGNAITNLVAPRGGVVEVGGLTLPVTRTYADVKSGALTALVGSGGFVEVAQRDGSAARTLDLMRGAPVVLHPVRP